MVARNASDIRQSSVRPRKVPRRAFASRIFCSRNFRVPPRADAIERAAARGRKLKSAKIASRSPMPTMPSLSRSTEQRVVKWLAPGAATVSPPLLVAITRQK